MLQILCSPEARQRQTQYVLEEIHVCRLGTSTLLSIFTAAIDLYFCAIITRRLCSQLHD